MTRTAESAGIDSSTAAMRPFEVATSNRPTRAAPGSMRSPPRISRSKRIVPPCPWASWPLDARAGAVEELELRDRERDTDLGAVRDPRAVWHTRHAGHVLAQGDVDVVLRADPLDEVDDAPVAARAVLADEDILRPAPDGRGRVPRSGTSAGTSIAMGPATRRVAWPRSMRPSNRFIGGLPTNVATNVLRAARRCVARAHLLHDALVQDHDAVGHRHRLDLVVGDVDRRLADTPVELQQLRAHLHSQERVEVGERFVHEERDRVADDRPTQRDPLALSTGQLLGIPFQQLAEARARSAISATRRPPRLRQPAHLQREAEVRLYRSCAGRGRSSGTPSRRRVPWAGRSWRAGR